ncbi:MAG: MEMO1 family protein [Candidatus Thermoplasmatota archaeon]|nr:MEMO1 family protein [Candidatus Thermoplasmatota archaeon]
MKTIRNAVVAGQFYPGTETHLRQQIEQCFLEQRGFGRIPSVQKKSESLKGLVVPHAGFIYSGAIASHAYGQLAEQGFAETFVILGPNHTGMGSGVSVMTEGSWNTPLGNVALDESLARSLATGIIDQDASAHSYEHSIEVQLPFLQYIAQGQIFEFVPICMMMQDFITVQEVGEILATAVQRSKKKIVLVASSDFSHAGFNYQSQPPRGIRVDEYAKKQDTLAIQQILALDPGGLIETVENNNITMCGYGPVAAMLVAAKKLGAHQAELLKYGTSYEVHPGSSCVGYGAIAVS